ncbi:MAG: extracellular solute-binding protein [Alphaproteobacteria bacterium]
MANRKGLRAVQALAGAAALLWVSAAAGAAPEPRMVEIAQRLLRELKFDTGPIDNRETVRLTEIIMEFERSVGALPRGAVTDDLLQLLRREAWRRGVGQRDTAGRRPFGATQVREAQTLLAALGFVPGPVDGLYGAQTMVAVLAFQQRHDLAQDGLLDERLLTALRQASGTEAAHMSTADVVFYNWFDYIHDGFQSEIRKDKGIKVEYKTFRSVEELNEALRSGTDAYDIVVPTAGFMVRNVRNGLFRPLDPARFKNFGNLRDDVLAKLPAGVVAQDPATGAVTALYGIPYMMGSTGFGIRIDQVTKRIPGASVYTTGLIFDPEVVGKLKDCGVQIIDDADDVVSMALIHLANRSRRDAETVLNDPSEDDVKEAGQLLQRIRPFVRTIASETIRDNLKNGKICLALGYSGDILQAQEASDRVVYRIPRDGTLMWVDMLAVPANARHPDKALEVIDYLLDPKVIAKASNHVRFENANRNASRHLDKALANDIRSFPTIENSHMPQERRASISAAIRELWTAFKGEP